MENLGQKSLMKELREGKDLARQLMKRLKKRPYSQEEEITRDSLVGQILSSYEKALSIINQKESSSSSQQCYSSGNTSPRSVFFDQDTSTPTDFVLLKKRKTLPKWSEKVKVCLATGIEGPREDGYSWRKYGQKDILGSNHPRGYYRCTHRHSQGCLATKQVQKSDEDSSIFEVTYRGRHTCTSTPSFQPSKHGLTKEQEPISMVPSALSDLKAGLDVKTEAGGGNSIFPPFSFPPTPIEHDLMDNPFLAKAIMETNHFPATTWLANDNKYNYNVSTSESDLTEILSAHTSVTNSPIGDLDFVIGDMIDFESNFPLDSFDIFS